MRHVLRRRRDMPIEQQPDRIVLREIERDGRRLARQQPLGGIAREIRRILPESRRRIVAFLVPCRRQEQDLALRAARVGLREPRRVDRDIRRDVAQIEHPRRSHHARERRCLDGRGVRDEVRLRVDVVKPWQVVARCVTRNWSPAAMSPFTLISGDQRKCGPIGMLRSMISMRALDCSKRTMRTLATANAHGGKRGPSQR